jgi:FtsP/CotA-like multicopper oxidase with cupredoxin domain
MNRSEVRFTRRDMLRLSLMAGGASLIGGRAWGQACVDQTPVDIGDVAFTGCGVGTEPFPTSPFIMQPYTQPLPIPRALRPGWRHPDGTLASPGDPNSWFVRKSVQFGDNTVVPPGPTPGQQDALGDRVANNGNLYGLPHAGTHQLWTSGPGTNGSNLNYPDPILYHIRLQVSTHKYTTSPVVNIDASGNAVPPPPGAPAANAAVVTFKGVPVQAYLTPDSTIYGFNGTFPGPMINIEYDGHPALVRFENDLDLNPLCRDRQDFGAPDWAFLTHLHNGHTAPESDGQPHHMVDHEGGYQPGEWVDNLYLGYPAGGLDAEKQSFLWFHDHRMHHTGPNVYKGMVGLAPHYDPKLDNGDETRGLRLPGVRTNNGDGTFDVDYDIPMAFYDCILDNGVTPHQDEHTALSACGAIHPEWWGQLFHKHYPNHGFVGDIFTINGVAYPTLAVKRRKYRFRWLGASVSRQYELSFRQGTPMAFPGMQGQWNFGAIKKGKAATVKGTTVMLMTQIASEGGLLPTPIIRDSIEIWPAKRREVIVDFSKYRDGSPTKSGEVIYLTNTLQMLTGRKRTQAGDPGFDSGYAVPMLKIVIDGDAVDNSVLPVPNKTVLRPAPFVNFNALKARDFTLQRGGTAGGETEWLINGMQFDPLNPLATPSLNSFEAWGINNGGGGWTHPMHLHMEEHHVLSRTSNQPPHPDDTGKEDVVALEGSEQTVIYRGFRTFLGNYVAHCHNLAHEDHNMMFGWTIVP